MHGVLVNRKDAPILKAVLLSEPTAGDQKALHHYEGDEYVIVVGVLYENIQTGESYNIYSLENTYQRKIYAVRMLKMSPNPTR